MKRSVILAAMLAAVAPAMAADWSDTSIAWRTGTRFAEPFNAKDIRKDIVQFTHASGYKYGSN